MGRLTKQDRKGRYYVPDISQHPDGKRYGEDVDRLAEYENTYPSPGWFSVSDKLPDQPGRYLTVQKLAVGQTINIFWWHVNSQRWMGDKPETFAENVTHWMEISKPLEVEEDG